MVLVYGLAVAPVVHSVVGHGSSRRGVPHGHTHAHGPESEAHSHGPGPGAHGDARKARAVGEHGGTGAKARAAARGRGGTGEEAHAHAPAERHGGASARAHAAAEAHGGADEKPRSAGPEGSREGHPDGHGPDGHQHLTGSVEHLNALVASWAVVKPPRARAVSWVADVARGPLRAPGSPPRLPGMPQGP